MLLHVMTGVTNRNISLPFRLALHWYRVDFRYLEPWANSTQNRYSLHFRHTFVIILPSETRTLDNSNLPLTRSDFRPGGTSILKGPACSSLKGLQKQFWELLRGSGRSALKGPKRELLWYLLGY